MPDTDPRQLLATLTALESQREPRPEACQRRFRRFSVRSDAQLQTVEASRSNEPAIAIQVRDASRTGIGFLCDQPIPVNSVWRLCILSRGYVTGHQPVVIRHVTALQEGTYLIGGQFCIDNGLLCVLGVDPRQIDRDERPDDPSDEDDFVAPAEVA